MIGAVTAGLCIAQANATWDGVVPMSTAIFLTTSAMARPRSLSAPFPRAMFLRVPIEAEPRPAAEPPPWSRSARVYLPARTPLVFFQAEDGIRDISRQVRGFCHSTPRNFSLASE